MNQTTKQEALKKIEELKKYIEKIENQEWVDIDYSVIPKELFDKYGIKPFKIMKRKMRDENGEIWNNINYFDAQKECKKLGCRLLNVQEMLMLLEFYKQNNKNINQEDKEFLGIEELSCKEDIHLEWIFNLFDIPFVRGGYWYPPSNAGVFSLFLNYSPLGVCSRLSFRCVQ